MKRSSIFSVLIIVFFAMCSFGAGNSIGTEYVMGQYKLIQSVSSDTAFDSLINVDTVKVVSLFELSKNTRYVLTRSAFSGPGLTADSVDLAVDVRVYDADTNLIYSVVADTGFMVGQAVAILNGTNIFGKFAEIYFRTRSDLGAKIRINFIQLYEWIPVNATRENVGFFN